MKRGSACMAGAAAVMACLFSAHPAWAVGPQDAPPPSRAEDTTAHEEEDVVSVDDGTVHRGHIISELQQGILIRTRAGSTVLVPYAHLVDLKRAHVEDVTPRPSNQPVQVAPSAPAVRTPQVELPSRAELFSSAMASKAYRDGERSAALAYLFEVLLPGAGLIYAGSVAEGVGHLMLVVLLPLLLAGMLVIGGGLVLALTRNAPESRVLVYGLGLNVVIIGLASVIAARVTAIFRAGPAASNHNTRLLGDLMREQRKDAWQRANSNLPEPPPETAEEDPNTEEDPDSPEP